MRVLRESIRDKRHCRRGAAIMELALILPVLLLVLVLAVDYSRVFYYAARVTNCAQNGALWASDPLSPTQSRYKTLQEAVQADFPPALQNKLKIEGPTASGENVGVTVTFDFEPLTSVLSSKPIPIERTVQARVLPLMPR
jgi:Flp pilus assembly protein TadG